MLLNGVTLDLLAAACYDVGTEPLGREKLAVATMKSTPMALRSYVTTQHIWHRYSQCPHTTSGRYHYHGNPNALFESTCGASPSGVIGFAADGYPIYGSCIADPDTGDIRKATSSYALKNNGGTRQAVTGYTTPVGGTGTVASNNYDGQFRGDYEYVMDSGDLDECNGMTANGQYGYYVIDEYPWAVSCFKGSVDGSFTNEVEQERRSHSHGDLTHSH